MNPTTLASLMLRHGLLDPCAMDDPEGFDNYTTHGRVCALARELSAERSKMDTLLDTLSCTQTTPFHPIPPQSDSATRAAST